MPLFKKDKPKSAPTEDLFKQDQEGTDQAYISKCPQCGATVTRAMYKCPECKKILL